MKVVVVGAGSIGANIGYSLAKAGADVTVIDAVGPAAGTSGASLSWLASFPQLAWREHPGRAALRHRVDGSFVELQEEIGGDWLHWSGTLTWGTPAERQPLRDAAGKVANAGPDIEILDAVELNRRYPGLAAAPDDEFIWEPRSGWVDAPHMVDRLIAAMKAHGGNVEVGRAVVGFIWNGDRIQGVRLADGTELAADRVVVAAGAWGTHVAAMAGLSIPMSLAPGLVVKTMPLASGIELPVLNSPSFSSRPDPSGGMAVHWRGRSMLPDDGGSPQQTGNGHSPQAAIDDVAASVPSLRGTSPASARIGIRALPDGGPIVGSLPGREEIYFALSHGGIGWGPTWGWAARRELLENDTVLDLSGMRPDRYFRSNAMVGRFADDAEQALSIAPS